MTQQIDRFWIARGVRASELRAIKGRTVAYVGLGAMALAGLCLSAGIAINLLG